MAKHVCPYCGLVLQQRIFGVSINDGCPDCKPNRYPEK